MRGDTGPAPLSPLLFLTAFVIATCGLIYELVAGALASYLVGDSVTQFSLVIGTYLSAMGVGSYLSRYVTRGLLSRFVEIEVAVALVGGLQAPVLFAAFVYSAAFVPLLYGFVFVIGTLVGLELPLLIRVLEGQHSLRDLVARVLFLDYIGALAAAVLFPLVLVPHLGLFRTSILFGILNATVALWTTFLFQAPAPVMIRLRVLSAGALFALIAGMVVAGKAENVLEAQLFADPVVMSTKSPYQRIALTHSGSDTRLFLNGALQFSSLDEYRYHEALVHPAAISTVPGRVLVLGGGDGLAVREILRHDAVQSVTLVDLDPVMTGLFRDHADLSLLNSSALADPRVQIVNEDAFTWMQAGDDTFDLVIIDFPDPNNYALGKLYTNHFYRLLSRRLAPGAAVAIQATSPLFAPRAFWCVVRTLEYEGYLVRPFHAYVPSFGEWGFVLASREPLPAFGALPAGLRFLDADTLTGLFHFPPDMRENGQQYKDMVPVNRLDNQALVRLYEEDWETMVHQ